MMLSLEEEVRKENLFKSGQFKLKDLLSYEMIFNETYIIRI